jgi:hypothetical protein
MSTVTMPASVRAAVLTAENSATVAVAVLDTRTGQFYGSAQDETPFPAESLVKVLIAADLLATGRMTGATAQMAYQMITQSDDDDANALWGTVGGPAVVGWAETRYGIADLGSPPTEYGWWGNTKFTARGLVQLYAAIAADHVVGPWVIDAMSHMSAKAADGTDQDFGLAAQTTVGAFKQGWGGDDDAANSEQLNSTGLLDGRYAVAILVQHVPYEAMSSLLPVINTLSAAVAPHGKVASATAAPVTAPSTSAAQAAPLTPSAAAPAPPATASGTAGGIGAAPLQAAGLSSAQPLLQQRLPRLVLLAVVTLACLIVLIVTCTRLRRVR